MILGALVDCYAPHNEENIFDDLAMLEEMDPGI